MPSVPPSAMQSAIWWSQTYVPSGVVLEHAALSSCTTRGRLYLILFHHMTDDADIATHTPISAC